MEGTKMYISKADKAAKLKRSILLRFMNMIGMISWHKDRYEQSVQKIRLLHPVSWVWIALVLLFGILAYGFLETKREIKSLFRDETVYW